MVNSNLHRSRAGEGTCQTTNSLEAEHQRARYPERKTMMRYLIPLLLLAAPALAAEPELIRLWPDGAPGSVDRMNEPETRGDWWVANVHHPSLTIHRPDPQIATGTAAVIVPGGGHRKLVIDAEGHLMAKHLQKLGVTAFVLKHRLAREENSPYQIEVHAAADGRRAMRWVRHHAADYDVDPNRIGMVGFSAGGEVVSMVLYGDDSGDADATDPIDRQSCEAAFQVLVYPGPLGIPETTDRPLPPAFMVVASDDGAADNLLKVAGQYRQQKRPFELHVYAAGGHGFNMGQRSKLKTISTWPGRLDDWLADGGWLGKSESDSGGN